MNNTIEMGVCEVWEGAISVDALGLFGVPDHLARRTLEYKFPDGRHYVGRFRKDPTLPSGTMIQFREASGAHKELLLGSGDHSIEIREGQPGRNETDPTGRAASQPGAKLDAGKPPVRRGLLEYFPRACLAVADISARGAEKYTWGGWRTVPDGVGRYGDAEVRHICEAAIHGETAPDFGLPHAAHEAWNALARLELLLMREEEGHD